MFNHPRRPYYNYRISDMPREAEASEVQSIESNRFLQLIKNLRHRQAEVKEEREGIKPASTGK